MSPPSQTPSQVEKYIGTDLISSRSRDGNRRNGGKGNKPDPSNAEGKNDRNSCGTDKFRRRNRPTPNAAICCDVVAPRRVKGGAPIFVVFDNGRRKSNSESFPNGPRMPLSRLAVHASGAPLMIAGRCDDARKNRNRGNGNGSEFVGKRPEKFKKEDSRGRGGTSDRLSVASDESSGSSHSENCLPRIIKPRKRRKKDRKPAVNADESPSQAEGTVSGNVVGKNDDIPSGKKDVETIVSEDEFHGPRLDHSFEDVTESDAVSYACSPSSCGCRYCDPSGIWDAPSGSPYSSRSDPIPKKSWSEPTRLFPLWKRREVTFSKAPGTPFSFSLDGSWNPGRSEWESLKGCEIDAKTEKEPSGYDPLGLQVSTEIVTSPNGHRDIEIRFYSASPPA